MDKKILGYFAIASVIVFGGIYLYNKNKNNSYIKGGTIPSPDVSKVNHATEAGMPFALDLTKIITVSNNGLALPASLGFGIVYNVGDWKNNTLEKKVDGYYLCNMIVGGRPTYYVYDLKTGAFLKTWVDPNYIGHDTAPNFTVSKDPNTAILAGMPASIDISRVTLNSSSMFYTLPDGTKLSINHIGDDGSYWIYKDANQYNYDPKTGAFIMSYIFTNSIGYNPLPPAPNGDPNVDPNGMPIDPYPVS